MKKAFGISFITYCASYVRSMLKQFISLCLLFFPIAAMAQQYSGNISDFKPVAMEVVVFPFGMDYPVKIGLVDAEGRVQINLDSVDINNIPTETKNLFLGLVSDNFFVKCDDAAIFQSGAKIKAITCAMPSLWYNKEQAGTFFLVSDEKLKPWIEDRYYMEPVKASFFEILYVDKDVAFDKSCPTTYNLERGNVAATNNFKLKLKKGFNLVQYTIEDIHKTDPNETSSIPVKVRITNPEAGLDIKWIVKYF